MKAVRLIGILIVAMFCMTAMTGCYSKPQSGEIGVVRNGGPFDNHKIRQVIPNGAGNTWTGFGSETHFYPVDTQQRLFRLQTCYDDQNNPTPCDGADDIALTEPTSDGVEVGVEGTFYLNTAFNDSPQGIKTVEQFDTQFGTRTFGSDKHAWDGNSGWSEFLGAIVEPVIQNNLRSTLSGITCAELVSSCALVQNSTNTSPVKLAGKNNQSNVQKIQDTINANLQSDLNDTLKGDYFTNIRFNLTKVDLPQKVQDAIDTAQASFAAVSQAAAKVKSAKLEAQANEQRQEGYLKCPTCAKIDAIRALPQNLQALGSSAIVSIGK